MCCPPKVDNTIDTQDLWELSCPALVYVLLCMKHGVSRLRVGYSPHTQDRQNLRVSHHETLLSTFSSLMDWVRYAFVL